MQKMLMQITTQQTGTSQDNVQKRSSKSTSEVSSVSSICDMDTNRTVQAVFTGVEVKPCGKAGRGLRMIKHKSECYSLDKNSSTIECSKECAEGLCIFCIFEIKVCIFVLRR